MNKSRGIKVVAAGAIALLSVLAIAAGNAFAQDNQKPAAQTEQMSGCECCKKMMGQKTTDSQNKMPGMNHSAPSSK